jgi:hypothetical protein
MAGMSMDKTLVMDTTELADMGTAGDHEWPRGVAKPAQRSLEAAGVTRLEDLAQWRFAELAALKGMGPRALVAIETALARRNLALKDSGKNARLGA